MNLKLKQKLKIKINSEPEQYPGLNQLERLRKKNNRLAVQRLFFLGMDRILVFLLLVGLQNFAFAAVLLGSFGLFSGQVSDDSLAFIFLKNLFDSLFVLNCCCFLVILPIVLLNLRKSFVYCFKKDFFHQLVSEFPEKESELLLLWETKYFFGAEKKKETISELEQYLLKETDDWLFRVCSHRLEQLEKTGILTTKFSEIAVSNSSRTESELFSGQNSDEFLPEKRRLFFGLSVFKRSSAFFSVVFLILLLFVPVRPGYFTFFLWERTFGWNFLSDNILNYSESKKQKTDYWNKFVKKSQLLKKELDIYSCENDLSLLKSIQKFVFLFRNQLKNVVLNDILNNYNFSERDTEKASENSLQGEKLVQEPQKEKGIEEFKPSSLAVHSKVRRAETDFQQQKLRLQTLISELNRLYQNVEQQRERLLALENETAFLPINEQKKNREADNKPSENVQEKNESGLSDNLYLFDYPLARPDFQNSLDDLEILKGLQNEYFKAMNEEDGNVFLLLSSLLTENRAFETSENAYFSGLNALLNLLGEECRIQTVSKIEGGLLAVYEELSRLIQAEISAKLTSISSENPTFYPTSVHSVSNSDWELSSGLSVQQQNFESNEKKVFSERKTYLLEQAKKRLDIQLILLDFYQSVLSAYLQEETVKNQLVSEAEKQRQLSEQTLNLLTELGGLKFDLLDEKEQEKLAGLRQAQEIEKNVLDLRFQSFFQILTPCGHAEFAFSESNSRLFVFYRNFQRLIQKNLVVFEFDDRLFSENQLGKIFQKQMAFSQFWEVKFSPVQNCLPIQSDSWAYLSVVVEFLKKRYSTDIFLTQKQSEEYLFKYFSKMFELNEYPAEINRDNPEQKSLERIISENYYNKIQDMNRDFENDSLFLDDSFFLKNGIANYSAAHSDWLVEMKNWLSFEFSDEFVFGDDLGTIQVRKRRPADVSMFLEGETQSLENYDNVGDIQTESQKTDDITPFESVAGKLNQNNNQISISENSEKQFNLNRNSGKKSESSIENRTKNNTQNDLNIQSPGWTQRSAERKIGSSSEIRQEKTLASENYSNSGELNGKGSLRNNWSKYSSDIAENAGNDSFSSGQNQNGNPNRQNQSTDQQFSADENQYENQNQADNQKKRGAQKRFEGELPSNRRFLQGNEIQKTDIPKGFEHLVEQFDRHLLEQSFRQKNNNITH